MSVLRRGRDVILAQGDIQLAIATEGEPPALVAAVRSRRQIIDDGGQAGARPALIVPADDALKAHVVGAAVEGVDEVVFVEGRAQREAEQPALPVC